MTNNKLTAWEAATPDVLAYMRRTSTRTATTKEHREALAIADIMSHITDDPVLAHYFKDQQNALATFVIDTINKGIY